MTDKKSPFDASQMTDAMKSQAQQIWLAGLGAFSKAQQDGAKAFEKLVHDGISMQRQAQSAAEGLAEATQRATQAARQFGERAGGQWDKFEGIFEERVAKALHRMGIPSAQELQALQARIEALEAQLASGQAATRRAAPAKRPVAAPRAATPTANPRRQGSGARASAKPASSTRTTAARKKTAR